MLFTIGTRRRRAAIGLVAVVGLLAAVVPTSAWAGGRGATIVRGVQQAYGTCGNGEGYLMEGSLDGCWWVDTFVIKPTSEHGTMLATGEEHFEGCLGSVCGSFKTRYTYTAKFDGATELHGRCHHPIVEGTDGFYGARGELSFTDVVDAEPFFYPYWGNIQLGRGGGSTELGSAGARSATDSTATAPC